MTVRPRETVAVAVTSATGELTYDLRRYDGSQSLVPLWWFGVWERGTDELVRTEVLDGPCSVSPLDLHAWLTGAAPDPVAALLVSMAARAVGVGPALVP